MSTQEPAPVIETLTAMPAGQEFEIVRTMLRDHSAHDEQQHLRPGRQWRCRYCGSGIILLVSRTGQTISVRRDEARYVEVRRIGDPAPMPEPVRPVGDVRR